jgi:hypothetical protein
LFAQDAKPVADVPRLATGERMRRTDAVIGPRGSQSQRGRLLVGMRTLDRSGSRVRRVDRHLRYGVVLLVLGVVAPPVARATPEAEPGGLAVDVLPAKVQLEPGEPVRVLLVARNSGATPVALDPPVALEVPGLTVSVAAAEPGAGNAVAPAAVDLAPGSARMFAVTIERAAGMSDADKVHVRFSYQDGPADKRIARVLVASIDVQRSPVQGVDKLAAVSFETSEEKIDEAAPGVVFLTVRSTADVPLVVDDVVPVALAPVAKEPAQPTGGGSQAPREPSVEATSVEVTPDRVKGTSVAPGGALTIPVRVTPPSRVRTGARLIVLRVDLKWTTATGRPRSGSLTVSHKIDVGIPAVSDALQVLGVPSFLLLPGFLFLVSVQALRRRVWPRLTQKDGDKDTNLDAKSPEFWLYAITLSILAWLVYRGVTGVDYIRGYGLRDVGWLWFGSIVAGALLWVVWGTCTKLWRAGAKLQAHLRALRVARVTFTKDDNVETVLKRMSWNHAAWPPLKAQGKLRYLVMPRAGGPGAASDEWTTSAVYVSLPGGSGAQQTQLLKDLHATRSAAEAYHLLVQRKRSDRLAWEWSAGGPEQETAPLVYDQSSSFFAIKA